MAAGGALGFRFTDGDMDDRPRRHSGFRVVVGIDGRGCRGDHLRCESTAAFAVRLTVISGRGRYRTVG